MEENTKDLLPELLREIKELKSVLIGNKEFGQNGIIHDISELKEFQQNMTKLKWYSLGGFGFAAFVFGIIKYAKELFYK